MSNRDRRSNIFRLHCYNITSFFYRTAGSLKHVKMNENIEIRIVDNLKGKGMFAKRKLETGSIIFNEDPLVCCQFSWNASYSYKACDHCLKPLETAEENARRLTGNSSLQLPYPECCTTEKAKIVSCSSCGELYCSSECQTNAFNQYHRVLCLQTTERTQIHPLEQLNEAWKQIHYPPETSTIMLIVRLLARIIQSPNRDAAIQETLQFCHRSVNEDAQLAHKFLGDKFVEQQSLLYNLIVNAVPHEGIESLLTPSGFESLLALLGTNGQGVGTSAISQWVQKTSELPLPESERDCVEKFIDKLYEDLDIHSGSFLNNEGIALYKLQSASNHSCVPNAEPAFVSNNSRLSLIALKDIEIGEEICISYLDECNLERSRHSRQKTLKENYLFVCKCPKCEAQADDPDVTSEEEDDEMSE